MVLKKKYPLILLLTLFGFFATSMLFGVIINVTPSMPEGIYIRQFGAIHVGDIVLLCLNEPYKSLGIHRLYVEKGNRCQGSDPLVKEVIAIPGDTVVLNDKYVQVNDIQYIAKTFSKDSLGRPLEIYPSGRYSKTTGYWLLGTHAFNSWDSRYWGPISPDQILYKLRPLWTW